MANTDENKYSLGDLNTSADELLRSLNEQYKDDIIIKDIAENNENIDMERLENAADSTFANVQIDMSSLSDDEFKFLFDSYLATSDYGRALHDADYEKLHKHIINLQKRSGVQTLTYDEIKAGVYNEFIEPAEAAEFETDSFDDESSDGNENIDMFRPETGSYDIGSSDAVSQHYVFEEEKSEKKPEQKRKRSVFAWLKALSSSGGKNDKKANETSDLYEQTEESTVFDTVIDGDSFFGGADVIHNDENIDEELHIDSENETTGALADGANLNDDAEGIDISAVSDEDSFSDVEFSGADTGEYEEDISPTEEMLENRIEDTSMLDAFEPSTDVPEDDILTEENEAMMTDTAMMKAFGFDPLKGTENDIPKDIFGETSYTTLEKTVEFEKTSSTDISEEIEAADETVDNENEYVSFDQNKEIFEAYKRKYSSVRIRTAVCAVFAFILFVIENIGIFGWSLPSFMHTATGYATVEWALLFACALLVCDNLITSAKKLFKLEFTPDSVMLIAFIMSIATSVTAFFTQNEHIKMFNLPFAICVLFCLICSLVSIRKEMFTFKVISSSKNKYAVAVMPKGKSAAERTEFEGFVSEDSNIYGVVRADFVGGYLKRKRETPQSYKKLGILIPAAFAVSVLFGIFSAVFADAGLYGSFSNAYITFFMCAPAAVFFAYELPMYMSAARAYSNSSAIIGDAAPEMVEKMSVVALSDNDIFQNDGVKIKSVKVIENNKIENVIYYASAAFSLVGGPLAKIFKQATLDTVVPESAELRVLSDMGIDATVDGKHIVIGVPQYMDAQCFQTIYETNDERWEGKTNRRILYLACDEEIIAKFYIEYNVSQDFVYLVKRLSSAGVGISVRSNDPCIDPDIFYRFGISPEDYPIRVIKGEKEAPSTVRVKAKDTIIVSTGSLKGLVKSLLLCGRVLNVTKILSNIKAFSAFLGAVIMIVLIFTGMYTEFWSVYTALYQALWIIPFYFISKF